MKEARELSGSWKEFPRLREPHNVTSCTGVTWPLSHDVDEPMANPPAQEAILELACGEEEGKKNLIICVEHLLYVRLGSNIDMPYLS